MAQGLSTMTDRTACLYSLITLGLGEAVAAAVAAAAATASEEQRGEEATIVAAESVLAAGLLSTEADAACVRHRLNQLAPQAVTV